MMRRLSIRMEVHDVVRRLYGSITKTLMVWLALIGFLIGLFLFDDFPVSIIPMRPARLPIRPGNRPGHSKIHGCHKGKAHGDCSSDPLGETGQQPKHEIRPLINIDTWLEKIKPSDKKPNVLFLVADDMRPDIKAYVHSASPWIDAHMVTPHLDQLASQSLLLRRAYCQQSWCNPSRTSFLTSRRPDTTMVHNNSVFFRQINPNFKTLPQYFKENGYYTLGMGKVFHLMGLPGDHDDEFSWSSNMLRTENYFEEGTKAWRAITEDDRQGKLLQDEMVVKQALQSLDMVAKNDKKPFFIAVGIKKPHLNLVFPAKFQDNYPLENISMPANPTAPIDMPGCAWFNSNEIRGREEYEKECKVWGKDHPLEDWVIKELRRAYWSTISYVDHLLGQVLAKLEELDFSDNTIVSFIGDHGYHLGEHSIFGKNTNFEVANNSPMMIKVPGVTDQGLVSDRLVEFVDIFPTIVDLAGLPKVPICPGTIEGSKAVDLCSEGISLLPLFSDPSTTRWKDSVFYQYPHYTGIPDILCMGYSVRTETYRYTEWVDYHYPTGANWSQLCGVELYDITGDPNETVNRAHHIEYNAIKLELSQKLKQGWAKAIPR